MDKYDIGQPLRLKKGVYKLNAERNFDYQLNRVINWDGGRIEDIQPVAGKIKTSSDWKRELIALGDRAMAEGRTQNAIYLIDLSSAARSEPPVVKKCSEGIEFPEKLCYDN